MDQETVFVYKKSDRNHSPRDSQIRRRLNESLPLPPPLANERLSRYLEAREIIDSTYTECLTKHNQTLATNFSNFHLQSKSPHTLPLTIVQNGSIDLTPLNLKTVKVHSTECPNFKTTLKLIVDRFTKSENVNADRRLTYDLDVLVDSTPPTTLGLVVIIENCDAFDPLIIRSLISQLCEYRCMLPLHLVLQISTNIMMLEQNLSMDEVLKLETQVLNGEPSAETFLTSCKANLKTPPTLQLDLSDELMAQLTLLTCKSSYHQLKYTVLGHFAGNPYASTLHPASLPDFDKLSESQSELKVNGKVLNHVFNPHYRPLVESALCDVAHFINTTTPSTDLGDTSKLKNSIPLNVMYQLYRDSSVYINIFDYYQAFKQTLTPIPHCDWDKQSMALFLEAITTLKLLGILRDCKRKFECVEKVSFKGV